MDFELVLRLVLALIAFELLKGFIAAESSWRLLENSALAMKTLLFLVCSLTATEGSDGSSGLCCAHMVGLGTSLLKVDSIDQSLSHRLHSNLLDLSLHVEHIMVSLHRIVILCLLRFQSFR